MTISATDLTLRAFEARPTRAEALADLARHFRDRGMNETAAMFARRGLAVPPSDDLLFVETWARGSLAEDLAVAGYYSSDPDTRAAAREVCDRMSFDRALGEEARSLARHNLHFYLQPIKDVLPSWSARRLTFSPPAGYHQMAPSVTRHGGRILAAQRCINYAIDAGGYYTAKGRISAAAPVHTRTLLIEFDPDTLEECVRGEITLPELAPHPGATVLGFEDSRLISWEGELWTISTVLDQNPHGHAEQWLARLAPNLTMVDARPIRVDRQQPREKNWVPFVDGPRLRFVYSIDPTRIIDTDGRTVAEHIPEVAAEHVRGGSQAIQFDDGWLAVVHWVEWFDGWPKYRHRFVHYDRDLRLRSMSLGWVFATERPEPALLEGYEYATGLCWHLDAKRLVVGYQVHEREAWVGTVTADDVRAALRRAVGVVGALAATTTPPALNVTPRAAPKLAETSWSEDADWAIEQTNNTLRDAAAIDRATRALMSRALPEHRSRVKNWDIWIALVHVLRSCGINDSILDAGGDRNAVFLSALAKLGFTQLTSLNLKERQSGIENGVHYMCGDITDTRLPDSSVKFIACLSVLEHGVDWRRFFAEAARLLAPAGKLFVSVDFWSEPVSTAHVVFTGNYAGQRWEIFAPDEVTEMIAHAKTLGLNVVGDVDLECHDRAATHLRCSYTLLNLLFEASGQPFAVKSFIVESPMPEYPERRAWRFMSYYGDGFARLWSQSVKEALPPLRMLDEAMHAQGIDGSIAEIGTLSGAYFLAMHQLLPEGATSLVIDCFDLPGYTPDPRGHGSGRASKSVFYENLGKFGIENQCLLVECDSGTLTDDEVARLKRQIGEVKFFSVDGLHTEGHTLNDLHIAEMMLHPSGVIILDDYLNPGLPEVKIAADSFMRDSEFVPIGHGFNKLYLMRRAAADELRPFTMDVCGRRVPMIGWAKGS